ncbi:hypothetical protein [Vagococcus xieshaowenii]|uniref:Prepilin type IV endopeptidase peptidase domain-containing protein n=1 Tax=Vagococcus xieshaowenii TaxID=2562451 RepID=A0AAJ5JLL0_9ENTE|nr:hypothetical protein [Vagococcus xieshaowenii]QCA28185.1 hypothetical protein E4Z98_02220 [Vagococcus xieshaowenii]TFZ42538.1 hypothetical protein E4031_03150 [Vagococcus xieshaowenii]
MATFGLIIGLTLLPIVLIPTEFKSERWTLWLSEPFLFITCLSTSILYSLCSYPQIFGITLVIYLCYTQAISDLYYQVVSPIILLTQLLISLLCVPHSLFQLSVITIAYLVIATLSTWDYFPTIGLGDIKLLFILFLQLSLIQFTYLLFFASSLALVYLLSLTIIKRSATTRAIPFVPFIFMGLLLSLWYY